MFYKDTASKMDVADPTIAVAANANHGLKKRYAFNQESGVIEMARPLFCDVFKGERLLLSFVDLKVILNRNVNEFCLMSSVHDRTDRARGQSMKKIVQLFGNDTVLNDSKVLLFVKTHFRVALKQTTVGFVQCCKKLNQ